LYFALEKVCDEEDEEATILRILVLIDKFNHSPREDLGILGLSKKEILNK